MSDRDPLASTAEIRALPPGAGPYAGFLPLLAAMGFVNLVFQAMASASVQLAVDPACAGEFLTGSC